MRKNPTDLLKYVMGLDLFGYIHSLEQTRNKLLTRVEILKASSLLLEVEDGRNCEAPSLFFMEEGNRFVRMHDVVRDVAKTIASKDPHHRFAVKEDVRLQEWEKRDDTFFKEMKEVGVLSLFRIDLTQLPSSLHFFSNLRTLCLHRCRTFKDITILGEPKKLQILSLVDCEILVFPKEIMQLTDLRMLNLMDSTILDPRNVKSSLSRLEYLCMRISFDPWESGGVDGGRRNGWLSELKHLSCLRALQLQILRSGLPSEDVSFENLTRYDISIGYRPCQYGETKTSRRLKLYKIKGPDMVKCFSKLLKTTEVLALDRLGDTKHFVYELDCDGFLQLKYLYISRSDVMQYIMNTMEMEWVDPPHSAFPLLEELRLAFLLNLEAVCHGPISMGCFANLRVLIIEECNSLKYIIWLPTTQARESVQVFPQLVSLKLERLPNLINFYSTGTSGSQEPGSSFFNQVALPELESLHLNPMDNVRTVWDNQDPVASVAKGLVQLKVLEIFDCGVEEIVANENGLEEVPIFYSLD
ncbi:hypothetical protein CK203_006912 [Vitis vinifera]|uniref:Disease resistance protein n=1 Tax=Vitis vinifera TaxID=29760 RepID=A0A438KCY7_VITVI|nr:hypothetical protein CK203_006912 [Vitis vinifera]